MTLNDVQYLEAGQLTWHDHHAAYLAVVLEGCYEEFGDQGRVVAEAGTAIVHWPFERHGNKVATGGARIVNLHLPIREAFSLSSMKLDDPERMLRAAHEGAPLSDALNCGGTTLVGHVKEDVDLIALGLVHGSLSSLSEFACDLGVAPRTLRRRFSALYGMSAASFRARTRAQRAWRDVMTTSTSLAAIAYDHGFADQAHMTRAIVRLTAAAPSEWRRVVAV